MRRVRDSCSHLALLAAKIFNPKDILRQQVAMALPILSQDWHTRWVYRSSFHHGLRLGC